MSRLLYHLRRSVLLRQGAGLTDAELLDAYAAGQDEAAFEALVRRHGPMVLGVCRRVLRDAHDADDAFQATFLVLVRRAASVPREAVSNWLYGVAYRTALNARRAAARRRKRETPETVMPHATTEPAEIWTDLRPVLDQELSRLPDKYRSAVVLCDLEGQTRKEAARQLGVPEGTVSGRLTTAHRLLAERLTRRGLTLAVGGLAAAVPATLIAATVRTAGAAALAASAEVVALADGVVKSLAAAKWKPLIALLLGAPLVASGTVVVTSRLAESDARQPVFAARSDASPQPGPKKTDRDRLQGTWVAVARDLNGLPISDPTLADNRFVFAGDRVSYYTTRREWDGSYRLDGDQTKNLAIAFDDPGVSMHAIYELSDDRLTVAWAKGRFVYEKR